MINRKTPLLVALMLLLSSLVIWLPMLGGAYSVPGGETYYMEQVAVGAAGVTEHATGVFYVYDDILVPTTSTLIINQSYTLQFDAGYGLSIDGVLKIEGTSGNDVLLTINGSGLWNGITFTSSSRGKGSNINNVIIEDAVNGVAVDDADPAIGNSTVQDCDNNGILITNGGDPWLFNLQINNNGDTPLEAGLKVTEGTPTVSDIFMSGNRNGIYAESSSTSFTVINSSISSSIAGDIRVYTNAEVTTLNTTFNKDLVNVDITSSLIVKWYVWLQVRSSRNSAPISGANVELFDADDVAGPTGITDANGFLGLISLQEYSQTSLSKDFKTPHNFSASSTGYVTNWTHPNIDSYKVVTLYLQPISYHCGVIPGPITLWKAEDNPHIVECSIVIPSGVRLLVEPGADIRVETDAWIYVDGRLEVEGNASGPVTFISNASNPDKADWKGIQFNASSGDYSLVTHAKIKHATTGIRVIQGANPRLNDTLIENVTTGLRIGGTVDRVEDLTITDTVDGIVFENAAGAKVENVHVSHSANMGAKFLTSVVHVRNSSISDSASAIDIILQNSATVYLLNTPYDASNAVVDATSSLYSQYFLTVNVTNQGQALAGANVRVRDNVSYDENFTTNANGLVENLVLTQKLKQNAGTTVYTPHNITVSAIGLNPKAQNVSMDSNQYLAVDLTPRNNDLSFLNLDVSADVPLVGEEVLFRVDVANMGTDSAEDVLVSLVVNGTTVDEDFFSVLGAGEESMAILFWTAEQGNSPYKILLDPHNEVNETDETNNILSGTIRGNSAPLVWINDTLAGLDMNGTIELNGTASDSIGDDDLNVTSVWIRFNEGDWLEVPSANWQSSDSNANVNWTYDWDSSMLEDGTVNISVRSNDGAHNSTYSYLNLTITNDKLPEAVIDEPSSLAGFYVNETVKFNGTGSSDLEGPIVGYFWDFNSAEDAPNDGDPSTTWDNDGDPGNDVDAKGAIVYHAFTEIGFPTIALRVVDSAGQNHTTTVTIAIANVPPVAILSTSRTAAMSGTTITLYGNESYDPDYYLPADIQSYFFDFGDGSNLTQTNPPPPLPQVNGFISHTYDDAGLFTLTLRVTDWLGANHSTSIQLLIISVEPKIDSISAEPGQAMVGDTVDFTALASDEDGFIAMYQWDFDGDDSFDWDNVSTGVTGGNVAHSYSSQGNFVAKVRATDNSGNWTERTIEVMVDNAPPEITFDSPASGAEVSGLVTIQLTAFDKEGDTVTDVQVKVDSGSWMPAALQGGWVLEWNTTTAKNGPHTLWARGSDDDGISWSDPSERTLEVLNVRLYIDITMDLDINPINPDESITLSGIASYNTGEPVVATTLAVSVKTVGSVGSVQTDANGLYSIMFSSPQLGGDYEVEVSLDAGNEMAGENTTTMTVNTITDADLSIALVDVTFTPTSPNSGEEVSFTVTLRNLGGTSASGTLMLYREGTSDLLASENFEAIPAGDIRFVEMIWQNTLSEIGTKDLDLKIEDVSEDESDELNNVVTFQIIFTGLPALSLSATDFELSKDRTQIQVGEKITLSITIHNDGVVNAENVIVKLYEGDPTGNDDVDLLDDPFTISMIVKDGVGIAIFDWYDTTVGEHLLFAQIVSSIPSDDDVSDNLASISITVLTKTATNPDDQSSTMILLILVVAVFAVAGIILYLQFRKPKVPVGKPMTLTPIKSGEVGKGKVQKGEVKSSKRPEPETKKETDRDTGMGPLGPKM